ncbi:23S rRNA (uracil(1939)-C(5))-methyltransferase RlmD [Gammaproteobacteria bacterium]
MINNQALNETHVESLSHDGRGIAHINGKIVFLENALPNEKVVFVYVRRHNKFDEAKVVEILHPSPDRVIPECPHFDICGGCSLQHLSHTKQISFKTLAFQEQMKHFGNLDTLNILSPITGPIWNYRNRARLSVKYVQKKQKVLVGFHEKNGRYVAEITQCPILHMAVSKKILDLSNLVAEFSIYNQIPQIEIACGDNVTALLFRHLQKFPDKDLELLQEFGTEHNFQIYLQAGGMETIQPLATNKIPISLSYKLTKQNIEMFFAPTDFTQINQAINQQMVAHVLELLDMQSNEKILDLFCGIGNFTLPLATKCNQIVGVEGNKYAIVRAKQNAEYNNIKNAEFYCFDLTKESSALPWAKQQYDKILLDPPRTGAIEICTQIKKFDAKKIVYVSCNHATLARDTKELTNNGYKLQSARIVDMFPHTGHMETIANFLRR